MPTFVINPEVRRLLEKLKDPLFEDCIPYMYVDSVGKITVGVGHNLTSHKDQTKLPFIVRRFERHSVIGGDAGIPIKTAKVIGRKATPDEIQNDFDFLTKHQGLSKYHASQKIERYTTVELKDDDIQEMFKMDCDEAAKIVVKVFPDVSSYPIHCQAALIDIAFNVGNFESFRHTFIPAIKGEGRFANKSLSERWMEAAAHSRRKAANIERNDLDAQWLKTGATAAAASARGAHDK
jgi:GH24 family phage-related lysozyme (muramidase)